jgi:hypothetical protein
MNPTSKMSAVRRSLLVAAAAALIGAPVLGAAAASSSGSVSSQAVTALAAGHHHHMSGQVFVDANGNKVEVIDPAKSQYIPKILRASDRDRAKARRILAGANNFCRTHTVKWLKKNWVPGDGMGGMHMKRDKGMQMKGMQMSGMHMKGMQMHPPTHYFNPVRNPGLHPAHPIAGLVYDGRLGGVMMNGTPMLPRLGSIPRPHAHEMTAQPLEMVHVYCTKNLRHAFTPNRVLGVKAPTINLRLKIRPAVTDLNGRQLRQIRAMVRDFCGDRLEPVYPSGTGDGTGPDPRLQAMRTEIRQSLMLMREHQLRTVWIKIQSF